MRNLISALVLLSQAVLPSLASDGLKQLQLISPNISQLAFHYQSQDLASAPVTLYALSHSQGSDPVVASISPRDGSFIWRLQWPDTKQYMAVQDKLILISSRGVTILHGQSGIFLGDYVLEEALLDVAVVENGSRLLCLSSKQVVKLDASNGEVIWTRALPQTVAQLHPARVIAGGILLIGPDNHPRMINFDAATGEIQSTHPQTVTSYITDSKKDIIAFPDISAFAYITNSFSIQSLCPSNSKAVTHKPSPDTTSTNPYVSIQDLGLTSSGYFLARKRNGAASVLRFVADAKACAIESAWEFNDPVSSRTLHC